MEAGARRPPLAAKPDQSAHRQPRMSKRKPAKYNDDDSYTTGAPQHACPANSLIDR